MATNECNENFTEQPKTTGPVETPLKRKAGRPKGSGRGNVANLTPFTSETAKAISASANAAKKARAEMRRRLLAAAVEAGIDSVFIKALKEKDEVAMGIVEKASKLTGIDWASSDENIQRVNVDAKSESKVKADYSLNINFTDATNEVK